MIPLSEIQWGPIDASANDPEFINKYIEPEELKKLTTFDYPIIIGEKGSGKTALQKGIPLKSQKKFTMQVSLDFNKIEFGAIVKNLSVLAEMTNIAQLTLITNYWEYVLIIETMKEYFRIHTANLSMDETRIHSYLQRHGLIEYGIVGIMGWLIEKCWLVASNFVKPKKEEVFSIPLPTNLSPQIVEKISRFPMFDEEFYQANRCFKDILISRGEYIYLSLDGFDRLSTSIKDQHCVIQIVFDGLVQATYELSISRDYGNTLLLKAFIPYDRYVSMHLRDKDKIDYKCGLIRWDYSTLKEFLSRRMSMHPKLQKATFAQQWRLILPEYVRNTFYNINESTYDYILRHTMYRPRHLQWHLFKLGERYPNVSITQNMIPKSIRESSKELVGHYLNEYSIDHPQLDSLLRRFKEKPNIMEYQAFRDMIRDVCKHLNVNIELEKKIDALYRIGLFGFIQELPENYIKIPRTPRYYPPRKKGVPPYRCNYYFNKPYDQISQVIEDKTKITIHPMFFDYCDLKPDDNYIVG